MPVLIRTESRVDSLLPIGDYAMARRSKEATDFAGSGAGCGGALVE